MKKPINIIGFILVGILASCNAFKQKVNVGPGTERIEDHTFEILTMLGVSFALGLWLGWILWNKYKLMVEGLQLENQGLTAALNSLRSEFDATKSKLATAENGWAAANQNVDRMTAEIREKNMKIEENEADLDSLMLQYRDLDVKYGLTMATSDESKEVPMEITTSPVDVFVEDLAEDFATELAPDDLVLPAVETITETVAAPEVEVELPKIELPEVGFPKIEMPEVELPKIELPTLDLPKIEVAAIAPAIEITAPKMGEVTETVVISIPEPFQTEIIATEIIVESPKIEVSEVVAEPEPEPLPVVEEIKVEEPVILDSPGPIITLDEPEPVVSEETAIPLMTFSDAAAPLVAPVPVSEKRDDLKVVEGIGPKIEELMYRNGIYTFTQLAATPVNRLKEMLQAEGPSYAMHDPGTWPAQSLLAANAEWENLRAYQSFLNAGKRPN